MIITGHISRTQDRIDGIFSKAALETERQYWIRKRDHYLNQLTRHLEWCGQVKKERLVTFAMIVREVLNRIRQQREILDILWPGTDGA